ncbi:MAG: amidohydrolase family protein, partial [Candidatus Melainabacteria bacterium]|nr:amidohydrolase family protein [Candidatus Melainabacteria bacterium]
GAIHEGKIATILGLPGLPHAAETACVAREIEVVRQTACRLHFAHISCKASVELIRAAKAAGVPVTAEVTPHHLALTVDDIKDYDTHYKMNPPLRTTEDQMALIAGLKDGTVSAIATDHAPHTALDKSQTFDDSPFGIIGLETAFSVTLEKLVLSGEMSKLAFIALLTTQPASILGLPYPSVRTSFPANLVVLNPQHRWLYKTSNGYSKSHNSPFDGRLLTGKNLMTIYNGKTVYKDNELTESRLKHLSR